MLKFSITEEAQDDPQIPSTSTAPTCRRSVQSKLNFVCPVPIVRPNLNVPGSFLTLSSTTTTLEAQAEAISDATRTR